MEVADVAGDLLDLAVAQQVDVRMPADVRHLGRQDAGRAVERREGLVELGHVAADRRLALDQVDLVAGVGQLERRLDAGDAAADDQRVGVDRHLGRFERLRAAGRAARRPTISALAFSSARPLSAVTHETCSRRLAMWHRYGFRPALAQALRKVFSCRCGEQAPMTTRVSPCFLMSSSISSWPSEEHMNL